MFIVSRETNHQIKLKNVSRETFFFKTPTSIVSRETIEKNDQLLFHVKHFYFFIFFSTH